ncbi:hypothetical protein SAM23877_2727 [Streptomyces ambofaciens ATCC 23877]|uniref:Uncharacterized protein n=1 Tax=Streptomyces ambofaciens (strain ATCC 23877 / 3486 / DSM 40053 / JCM 4204 / NBRC 12836 / NRRL B-2516) TaxID=278992 RepID=A0A0K2AS76_STRA7|nr:hypothetical protein SAM23877_2727 [Streptomyces ambofaciens ATCC 23877]
MRTAPRLLATPHLGYVSQTNYATYYGQAVEAIQAYLAGSPVRRLPAPRASDAQTAPARPDGAGRQ